MIYDKLSNVSRYLRLDDNLDLALRHIETHLSDVSGHVDISGEDVYVNLFSYSTVPEEEAFFEMHRDYADIHIMRKGRERVAVSERSVLKEIEAHPEQDFWKMDGICEVPLTLAPDSFLIVFPGEAHKLKMMTDTPETVTKAVYKIRIKSQPL